MSYHDRKLVAAAERLRKPHRRRLRLSFLDGFTSITINPSSPNLKLGTVGDDWRSVGEDIRSAMKHLGSGE